MLRKQLSRVGLIVMILVAVSTPLVRPLGVLAGEILATSTEAPSWLSAEPARAAKTGDLPSNTLPYSKSLDCNEKTIVDPVYGTKVTNCSMSTAAGPIVNGYYTDGVHQIARVFQGLLQSYGDSQLVYWNTGETTIYPALSKGQLVFNNSGNLPGYNYVPAAPYRILKSASGSSIYLDTFNMAYSNNGQWLVAIVMTSKANGLMVFDTKTYTGKFFASFASYSTIFGGNDTPGASNLAISDDGRFVAAGYTQTAQNATERGVRMYDTTTCTDQFNVPVATRSYCNYKNVWTGKLNGITKTSTGIKEQLLQTVERPLNIRFKDPSTITFSGIYDYVSMTNMKAATYEATMSPEPPPPPVKLLAMGDSYISGEGAFSYIAGTDTSNNKCHQSASSYPYLLGAQYAAEYHSVACSGAVAANIFGSDYPNQLEDPRAQNDYDDSEISSIIAAGQVGMIEQLKYVPDHRPNAVLLSIGGNDIGFNDIIKRCVISSAGNPCYLRESERKGLLETIYGKHDEFVSTYQNIISKSPAGVRLYVIGYPQVINPTGNCGVNVHFDDQERQFAVQLIDRLNATLKHAAESAGAVYVDTSNALIGHRLCDATDDGVNGLTDGDDGLSIGVVIGGSDHTLGVARESYHPTAYGHQLLSYAIDAATKHLRQEPSTATGSKQLVVHSDDPFITSAGIHDTGEPGKSVFQKIADAFIVAFKQSLLVQSEAAPGSTYRIVMHSDEVELASGTVPSDGKIAVNITVPHIEPGLHTIHIYAEAANGEAIDINQDIYIRASVDDYDGDGIKNADDALVFINETDHVIVPEEPSSDIVALDDNTSNQGTENSHGLPTPITQDAAGPVVIKTDAPQSKAAVTIEVTKSDPANPEVATIAESNVTQADLAQGTVTQELPEVLGASDAQIRVPKRNSSSRAPSKELSNHTAKTSIFLGSLIIVSAVVGVVVIKLKRSKNRSDRI